MEAAFDKLVEIAQDQTKLMTEHVMLLRELGTRLDRVAADHKEATAVTRAHFEYVINAKLSASERWWRRAFVVMGILVALGAVVGAALDKAIALAGH